jgi:hypothetical protein
MFHETFTFAVEDLQYSKVVSHRDIGGPKPDPED